MNLSSIISPGFPVLFTSLAFKTLTLDPFNSNQDPGFGYNALIFATTCFALSSQLIFDSSLLIFFA